MSYVPIKVKGSPRMNRSSSMSPYQGKNNRIFSALMKAEQALRIYNYIPDAAGKCYSRKGQELELEIAGTDGMDFFIRFTYDTFIYAYGTTVGHYNETTGVATTIKSDFSANDGFVGLRWGEYFFVVNGVDKMWRIDTAFTITEVAASPVMTFITSIGNRIAGILASDRTQIRYSEVDDGTNPPFTAWSNGTDLDQGGQVGYRNAGNLNTILFLGDIVIGLADYGKWGFTITTSQQDTDIVKIDQTVFSVIDLGGFDGIVTEKGIYYVNESAIMNLISVGQPNIPYSKQEFNTSYILGRDAFDDISFEGATMAYIDKDESLLISCKKGGATVNNWNIYYNTETKAYSEFSNWNNKFFYSDFDGTLYATSSVANKVYKCFEGYTDDGLPIGTEYYQEITNVGDFNTAKDLIKFMVQFELPPELQIEISFDGWDYYNVFQETIGGSPFYAELQNIPNEPDGYGESSYGGGGYGGNNSGGSEFYGYYDTYKPLIRNYQRFFVKIVASGTQGHVINMFMADVKEKAPIRIRNIVPTNYYTNG